MRHFTSPRFWKCYGRLPADIRRLADKNFNLLKRDSQHPSLHFKRVEHFWSVRVGLDYRALAIDGPEGLVWFWIGTHAEYDRLLTLRSLKFLTKSKNEHIIRAMAA